AQGDWRGGDTVDAALDDAEVAAQTVGYAVDQGGVVAERGELVGVLQQREHAQAELVGGRLVARAGQDERNVDALGVGERRVGVVDEPGQQVVGRVRALLGDQADRKSTRLNSSHVKISYA